MDIFQHNIAMVYRINRSQYLRDSGVPVAISRQTPQGPIGLHAHDFSELVIITRGRGVHVTEDDTYPVSRGDVFVINVDHAHGYRDTRNLNLINVLFDLDRLLPATPDFRTMAGYHALFSLEPEFRKQHQFAGHLHLDTRPLARVSAWISELDAELQSRAPGRELAIRAIFTQLIVHLARCYSTRTLSLSPPLIRVSHVIGAIESRYADDVCLDDLAGMAHMSPRTLLRTFRQVTGKSPIEYLLHVRIARAADLLRAGEVNVTEAALRVGFGDSNYFARQFRRITGQRPSDVLARPARR